MNTSPFESVAAREYLRHHTADDADLYAQDCIAKTRAGNCVPLGDGNFFPLDWGVARGLYTQEDIAAAVEGYHREQTRRVLRFVGKGQLRFSEREEQLEKAVEKGWCTQAQIDNARYDGESRNARACLSLTRVYGRHDGNPVDPTWEEYMKIGLERKLFTEEDIAEALQEYKKNQRE